MSGRWCTVFKGIRRADTYLYVDHEVGLEPVPSELLESMGRLSEVMTLHITPERRLARVNPADVLACIADQGYFLQMPPSPLGEGYRDGE